MYTRGQLSRFPYFEAVLAESSLESLLDPLTGLVARPYMLGFAQALIRDGTPFTFGILDLDNFKFINDTYGHHVGDGVLVSVSEALIEYMNGCGVAGRFGGDELLFINLRDLAYDDKKAFLNEFYVNGSIIRRNIRLENCAPFITGTVGCASFPADAADYDALFSRIDKTLYRGKTKGRNCYIIYVEEKHKDIQIRQIARHGVYTSMQNLVRHFEMVPGMKNRLYNVTPLLMDELRISELYYVDGGGILHAIRDTAFHADVGDIAGLMNDDLYYGNALEEVAEKCPRFHAALKAREVEALMVVRVGMDAEKTVGYLICAEPRSQRIWQEDECAIMYFLAKMIAARVCLGGEKLEY